MQTNCKNCGAPIEKGRCQYCGTDYRERIVVPAQGGIIMEGQKIGTVVAMDKYKPPTLHRETIIPGTKRPTPEQLSRWNKAFLERLAKNGS